MASQDSADSELKNDDDRLDRLCLIDLGYTRATILEEDRSFPKSAIHPATPVKDLFKKGIASGTYVVEVNLREFSDAIAPIGSAVVLGI